ncbi:MAG: FimV/HubP family polar landmark protein [Oleiphilus sp.]
MIRKLAIALSLLGACFTGFVHALGLGEVTVQSALNQPLNAEIELVNTAGLTIEEILPGLATREEFQKANVDRVYFLSDLRFEVVKNAQGKAVVILTSKKPVREPFLNFIVELIWPSGRLLREYALLIDPPLFSEQPAAKVSAPAVSRASSGDTLAVSNNTGVTKRPILAPVSSRIASGNYGPTDANDTLWDIAIQARPDRSVSPQQVMLAIQDLNPNAFIDDNINKLKAGQVLRLPSIDQIKQRSQHQAIQNVIAQNEALSGKRTASVADGSSKTKAETKPSSQASTNNVVARADELKLVVAETNKNTSTNSANAGQSDKTSSGNDTELAIALEKLDKTSIENTELNSRLTDLEEQLSTLQRLLTLKNDQLASIQSQMRANELEKLQAGAEAQNPVVSAPSEQDQNMDSQEPVAESQGDKSGDMMDAQDTASAEMSGTDENVMAEDGAAATEEKALSAKPVEETAKVKAEAKKDSAPEPVRSQNIIEMILSNPLYLAISVISILVLVVILWLVSRHNAKREEEFQSQHGLATDEEFDEVNVFDEEVGENFDETDLDDEQSLIDENEDVGDFTEELQDESHDILEEVNAYISYGRLDQAAQVLEKSISQDPVRTDYRLALLGVYKDLGDRQAFDRQFSELEAIQDDQALAQAEQIKLDMLDAENTSFMEESEDILTPQAEEQAAVPQDTAPSDDADKLDDDVPEELKSFDFDSVSLEEDTEPEELDLSTELDLDSLSADEDDVAELSDELETAAELSEDALEVEDELSLDGPDLEEVSTESDFDDSILDVDLDDLDLNAELDQESEIALTDDFDASPKVSETPEADELLVSDDVLEEAAQEFDIDATEGLDDDLTDADEFDFLNGTDEASTKLDLARAYIDMGDVEGAKDILMEVTKEGSEAQQAEAKDLLDSID